VIYLVFLPNKKTFACISDESVYICDSITGHFISGLFQLKYHLWSQNACFCPSRTCILIGDYDDAVIWDLKRGKEQFRIEGEDSFFIQFGYCHGSIASIY